MTGQPICPSSLPDKPDAHASAKRERERFFRLIPDLACVVRFDGYFAQINDCWEKTLGFSSEELLSRPFSDFIHPDDIQPSWKAMEELASGDAVSMFENRYRTKDGGYRWLQWCSVAIVEDETVYAVARDITPEKQRSQSLSELAEFNRRLLESSQDCIKVLDANGCLLSMSPNGQQLLEITDINAVLGKSWFDFWQTDKAHLARTAVTDALNGKNSRLASFCPTATGTPKWWDVSVSPIVSENGKVDRVLVISRDATDQRKSEENLRQSKEHFQALIELSPQVVWMADAAGAVHYVNPQWCALTGLTAAQSLGSGWITAIAPAYREKVERIWRGAQNDHSGGYEIEIPFLQADGRMRWHLAKGAPIHSEDGTISHWIGVALDIDERKRAQEDIATAAERFRFLAESAPQKVFTARTDGQVDYCNGQWLDYIGRPFDERSGDIWADIVHPDDRLENQRRWKQAVETGEPFQFAHRLRNVDGGFHWHLTRAHAMRDAGGDVLMWVGSSTDIHEMKNAQDASRLSEMRYRSLATSSAGVVWSCNPSGHFIEPIPSWESYTGQRFDDYRDKGWRNAVHPDDIDDLDAAWECSIRNVRLLEKRCRLKRHDGSWRMNLVRGVPVLSESGEVLEWVGTTVDIHDRSEAQRQLEEAIASERAARAEAERIGRVKDEFLTTLSHELRTPLNAIFGWSQILKRKAADVTSVTRGIEIIDRNVRVQTRLIEDLLDMSSIISGKIQLDIQPVRLEDILLSVIESVGPSATAKNIQIEHHFDTLRGSVHGDAGRLQQVFWNLLTNAIKFTPENGKAQVFLKQVGSQAEICVIDTGEGIAPDFLPHLFERFTQADASIRRKHGGLGIGLSIVNNLVEMHGGTVSADSAGMGKGARFEVLLPMRHTADHAPASGADADAAQCVMPAAPPRFDGVRILIVDDEPDARDLARHLLEERGAVTRQAASAADARRQLDAFQPQLILCDLGMPVEDGYAFMQTMRRCGMKTPAAALTAFAREEDRVRSLQAGFQTHLTKPLEPAELFEAVATLTRYG